MFGILLATVIELAGVTGTELRARAFFDANNVKRGDPLVLTIDFIGDAEFRDLHPPALSKAINARDWKIYDTSAKTSTFSDARRLTYRVRPEREGLLWFPELEFAYDGKRVKSNVIPVHVRAGAQVVVDEMADAGDDGYPKPPELMRGTSNEFKWRKALAHPSADAFAEFDTYEGRMNEATCALRDGNWARALKIYNRIDWTFGQTPEIERGIIAALARRYENPAVELPVWRVVLRPLLKFTLWWRIGIALGTLAALALVLWLFGRGIKAVAALAFAVLLVLPVGAQDIFQQIRSFQSGFGGFSAFGGMEEREPVRISASYTMKPNTVSVGENFEFILSLEAPKTASIGQINITPSERFGLTITGQVQNLPDAASKNPTNVIKRLAIPARYDVPFRGPLAFGVEGMVSSKSQGGRGGRGFFSFSFSNSFRVDTAPQQIQVKPLPSQGQPANFGGIVSEGLRLHEICDILTVGTNDVVNITYRMYPKGYVPKEFLPEGAAFEWTRQNNRDGSPNLIEYRRFFVADGTKKTPALTVDYYDPRTKTYRQATTGGTELTYGSNP